MREFTPITPSAINLPVLATTRQATLSAKGLPFWGARMRRTAPSTKRRYLQVCRGTAQCCLMLDCSLLRGTIILGLPLMSGYSIPGSSMMLGCPLVSGSSLLRGDIMLGYPLILGCNIPGFSMMLGCPLMSGYSILGSNMILGCPLVSGSNLLRGSIMLALPLISGYSISRSSMILGCPLASRSSLSLGGIIIGCRRPAAWSYCCLQT